MISPEGQQIKRLINHVTPWPPLSHKGPWKWVPVTSRQQQDCRVGKQDPCSMGEATRLLPRSRGGWTDSGLHRTHCGWMVPALSRVDRQCLAGVPPWLRSTRPWRSGRAGGT